MSLSGLQVMPRWLRRRSLVTRPVPPPFPPPINTSTDKCVIASAGMQADMKALHKMFMVGRRALAQRLCAAAGARRGGGCGRGGVARRILGEARQPGMQQLARPLVGVIVSPFLKLP
jgi:hypothetical protein